MAKRFDKAPIRKAVKLDNGFLRAPATLTRTGVFDYRRGDGGVRRELRLPEEVFAPEALASFELVPLTDDHPADGVHKDNAQALAVGAVGKVTEAGETVEAELLITAGHAVDKVFAGKTALSCGYECDLEEVPGVWQGQRYDAIQRKIRGNHVALVEIARAGPIARVRLDAQDAETIEPPTQGSTVKLTIDGIETEVSDTAAGLLAKERAASAGLVEALKTDAAKAKSEAEKATARADAAEAEAKKLAEDLAAAPAKVAAQVAARAALEAAAFKVMGSEVKLDDKSDDEIRKLVILHTDEAAKLDGVSAEYLAARFDAAIVFAAKSPKSPAAAELDAVLAGQKKDSFDTTSADPVARFNAEIFKDRGFAAK